MKNSSGTGNLTCFFIFCQAARNFAHSPFLLILFANLSIARIPRGFSLIIFTENVSIEVHSAVRL